MLPRSVQNLIDQLARLPGVGPKSAARFAFWLLAYPQDQLTSFGETMINLKKDLIRCDKCYNLSDQKLCKICSDPSRDRKVLIIVEDSSDVMVFEKAGYRGLYHVLGGVLSPINNIGPQDVNIKKLLHRLADKRDDTREVILATDPSTEGEATAIYLADAIAKLKKLDKIKKNIKVTRIAQGLPVGGDIEYADPATLRKSLEGRKDF